MSDIETIVDDVVEPVAKTSKTTKPKANPDERVNIIIASTEKDQTDVFVGVNGVTFLIKRDEVVAVPRYIYEHLINTKTTVFDPKTGAERLIASYPVSMA